MEISKVFQMQKAEYELIWQLGSPYPFAIKCQVFETNILGEKRFVEAKTFKLVEE